MNASEDKAKPAEGQKQKALCVATRCTSIEQFVATFHRFCDESSFFVATLATRPVGLETAFSIQLEDKTPVLRGLCVVVEAWSTPANRFGRPGVRLDVRRLTNESLEVFKMLQAARESAAAAEANAAASSLAAAMAEAATKAEAAVKAEEKKAEALKADEPKKETGKIEVTKFARASEPSMDPPKLPRATRDGLPPMPPVTPPRTPPAGIAIKPPPTTAKPPTPTQPMPRLATPPKGVPPTIEPAKVRAEGTAPVRPTPPPVGRSVTAPTQQMPPLVAQHNTPAVGLVTSSIAHSNAGETAEQTTESPAFEAKPAGGKPDAKSELRKKLESLSKIEGRPKSDTKADPKSDPKSDAKSAVPAAAPTTPPPATTASDGKVVVNPGALKANADSAENRAPGSQYVLPANPLMNLTDSSLEGFIDCALYEETANFFRAPGYEDSLIDIGEIASPPLAPTPVVRPGEASGETPPSYVGPMPEPPSPPQVMFHGGGGRTTPPPFAARDMQTGPMPPLTRTGDVRPATPTGPMPPLSTGATHPPPMGGVQTPPMGQPLSPLAFTARPETEPFAPRSDATPIPMLIAPNPQGAPPAYPAMTPFPPAAQVVQPSAYGERRRQTAITKVPTSRRTLVIGGSAAGALLLVIVIAAAASGDDPSAKAPTAAKTTPAKVEANPAKAPANVATSDKTVEKQRPSAPANAITTTPTPTPAAPDRAPAPVADPDADETDASEDAPGELPPDEGPQVIGSGPCQIQIATTPAGSMVRVDDRQIGPSPITIAGACKRTKIDAKHPRYAPATKWVTPVEGTPAVVDLPMVRPTHSVMITSNPAGATVLIGGRRAGTTPTSVNLMGFTTQTLTFEKKGYAKLTQKLYSKRDNDRVSVKLTRTK